MQPIHTLMSLVHKKTWKLKKCMTFCGFFRSIFWSCLTCPIYWPWNVKWEFLKKIKVGGRVEFAKWLSFCRSPTCLKQDRIVHWFEMWHYFLKSTSVKKITLKLSRLHLYLYIFKPTLVGRLCDKIIPMKNPYQECWCSFNAQLDFQDRLRKPFWYQVSTGLSFQIPDSITYPRNTT